MSGDHDQLSQLDSFILQLTGRQCSIDELSSAQLARLLIWAKKHGIEINNQKTAATSNIEVKRKLDPSSSFSIGIDIQSIEELFSFVSGEDESDFINSFFAEEEIKYAKRKPDPKQTLAGIFAAKEAVLKVSDASSDPSSVVITHDRLGRPFVSGFHISISHSQDFAIAIALSVGYVQSEGLLLPARAEKSFSGAKWLILASVIILGLASIFYAADFMS
jgi:phosphopantetheinyl transferase (holo-ACP synthase)